MIHTILNFFQSLGLPGIYFSMLIENLGIPFPTEGFYLLAQNIITTGKHSYLFVNIILTLGHMSGATIAYFVGRGGEGYLIKKYRKNRGFVETHEKIQKWFGKYGNVTILFTRLTGYVRPWSSLIIGFANVPFKEFFWWALFGTIIFNVITLYISSKLLDLYARYSSYEYIFIGVSVFIFLFLFVYLPISIYKRYSKKK